MALDLKYRPKNLAEFVGSTSMIDSFQAVLLRPWEEIPQRILIHGPRGCGKTTLGRIYAQAVGCSKLDFAEINTANYTGVDAMRDLVRIVRRKPMKGRARVWLLDEFHEATKSAQDCMLKTLEEPPKHAFFILCTTNPQKLLKTIRSRCMTFEVSPLSDLQMNGLLRRVSRAEKIRIPEEVRAQIIQDAMGSAREALVLLDKVKDLPEEKMQRAVSSIAEEQNRILALCRALFKGAKWPEVAGILRECQDNPESIRIMVLNYCSSVLLKGKADARAALVMDCLRDPIGMNGMPALVLACYEVYHAAK